MHLHLKASLVICAWLCNTAVPIISASLPENKFESNSESNGGSVQVSTVEPPGSEIQVTETPEYDIHLNQIVEAKMDLKKCSKVPVANSVPVLRCPDISSFSRCHIQGDNDAVEVEIDWVGGVFYLPRDPGHVQLKSLKIRNANITSFNISSETQILQSLRELDLSGNPDFDARSLVNLGTIESLTNLSMSGTPLKTLDDQLLYLLQNLPKLEYLDLSYCGIGHSNGLANFPPNTSIPPLRWLDLSGNPELNAQVLVKLGKLESLRYFSLRGTAKKTLHDQLPNLLQNLPNLEYLDLSYCGLRHHHDNPDIFSSVKILRSLTRLYLDGNPDFNAQVLVKLGTLESLTHLSMRGTADKTLDAELPSLLQNLPRLHDLDVSATGISSLLNPEIFASNTELMYLNVANNDKLDSVTFHMDVIHGLKYLNLSNCVLGNIKVLEDSAVGGYPPHYYEMGSGNIEKLDLSNNRLKEIPPALLYALREDFFTLRISGNDFGEASQNCQTYYLWRFLQSLPADARGAPAFSASRVKVFGKEEVRFREKDALFNCQWNSCPGGCQCDSKKKIVDCRNLGLRSVPLVAPSSAEVLLIQNNSLRTLEGIESPAWCNLRVLNAGYNNLTRIFPEREMRGNCSCETRESHRFEQRTCFPQNLEELILNDNIILRNHTEYDCSLLSPLRGLDLSGNQIKHLVPICDGFLERLKTPNLAYNEIEVITDYSISHYPRLKTLVISKGTKPWLSENSFESITTLYRTGATPNTATTSSTSTSASSTTQITPASKGLEETSQIQSQIQNVMAFTGFICLVILCALTGYISCCKNLPARVKRSFGPTSTVSSKKKYDCFVVCSSRDFREVREALIVPLTQRGYSIAWHDNAFVPGDWIMQNVERAVQNSSRMLVFGTENLVSSRWGLHEIRRGRHEEFVNNEFKVMALVTKMLPKKLNRDLYEIICLRTHIKLTDRDYIEQICRFLPQEPVEKCDLRPEELNITINDISDLLQRYEEIKRVEREKSTVRLAELFHTQREKDQVSIRVDIEAAFPSHVCDDKASCPTCQSERSAMIQRFKGKSYTSSTVKMVDTNSLHEYVLDGDTNIAYAPTYLPWWSYASLRGFKPGRFVKCQVGKES
ncbi:toll-like receptor 4 isoform X2 [Macrobrachium rosenbergii]|uniref:toll-like receptor 4 isoform X2 n=1 Tax=Macrobrachium rosenbergii TaxID=79674 RepID=UPI0034D3E5C0